VEEFDPYANDPGRWGASLSNDAEILFSCLDAATPASIVEIGAYAGDVTALLLGWARDHDTRVCAVDPSPEPSLVALAARAEALELIQGTSLEVLRDLPLAECYVIDGAHNYYTVSEELRLIGERADADGAPLPLFVFHDVSWPHARRDDYFDPSQVPAEHRHDETPGGGLFPGVPGTRWGGLPFHHPASREGGPRNGVLTAIEDFVGDRSGLRLTVVRAFFGIGFAWPIGAPYAAALEAILQPWENNPVLERLEANRVFHLANSHVQLSEAARLRHRDARTVHLLEKLLESKTFSVAVALSRLRQGGEPAFSKKEIRELLSGGGS
jgi:hypothetical protein